MGSDPTRPDFTPSHVVPCVRSHHLSCSIPLPVRTIDHGWVYGRLGPYACILVPPFHAKEKKKERKEQRMHCSYHHQPEILETG